jgi:hypothetical protein
MSLHRHLNGLYTYAVAVLSCIFFIYIQVYHSRMGKRWGDKLSPSLINVSFKPKYRISKNINVVDPDWF